MNSYTSYKEYTFLELLNQYDKILVPMIQRDYAQGRTNKKATDVRNNLLNDIFSNKKVHFDLVFGSVESRIVDGEDKRCFIPVDGQQRLTTLYLLYLYGQIQLILYQEVDLSKFTYDTRRAASDFCKSITSEDWHCEKNGNVSDAIKDCSWFMDYWTQDPTVEGMLNMLDAIHEKCKQEKKFPDLGKVTFYFFDLESNDLNENLYLKMNSRGKPLTAFENLKAKIEKVLPDNIKTEEKCFPECAAAPKDSFKENWKYFMDRNWTEAFWDPANPCKYDVNIAKFIVRFLSGYWAAFGQETAGKTTAEDLKNINRREQNDNNYSYYIQFEPIEQVLNLDNAFSSLAYALTIAPKITPYWTNDQIKVADKSEYKLLAVIFTYVVFDGDNESIRFAWNMAENFVTEYDNFVAYCKRVGEIHQFKCNKKVSFNQALSGTKFIGNISDQLKEEIVKAKQIFDENGNIRTYNGYCKKEDGSNYQTWEEIIIEAEKYAFFKGSIRFLFTKQTIGDDWMNFDTKWTNAQKYFDNDGVKNGTLYKYDALLMKSLLASCDDFGHKIWWHFVFSNDANRWKSILISPNWRNSVDVIMSKEVTTETTTEIIKCVKEPLIKNIVDDNLMDYVCEKMSGAWLRKTYHGYHAIWQSGYPSGQIVLNPILAKLKSQCTIDYSNNNMIPNCRYYKCEGKNVNFSYKYNNMNYFFQWWGTPNEKALDVYLMEDFWSDYKKRPNPTTDKGTDEDKHYCFRVETDNLDVFLRKLDALIEEEERNS